MRMMMNRADLLEHICYRLEPALDDEDGNTIFDVLAITGFELDSFEKPYWEPYGEEIQNIISMIREACLEYENDIYTDEPALIRLRLAGHSVYRLLDYYAREYADNLEPMPAQHTPIAQLLHRTFSLKKTPDEKKAEQDRKARQAERDIRRQQVMTHITVLSMQTDNALEELGKQMADLLKGGGPCT